MAPPYYLVDSDGYYYCVKERDLLVSKNVSVQIGQAVMFKYGAQTIEGTIMFKAGE